MTRQHRQARALLASIAREASGHSLRMVCPFCNGGQDGETSLVLTLRDDGAFYCCHRASCGASGVLERTAGASPMPSRAAAFQPREYRGGYHTLIGRWLEEFTKATGRGASSGEQCGLYVNEENQDMLVLECRDFHGEILGHQTRVGYPKEGRKSCLTYKLTPGTLYHYIKDLPMLGSTALCITEDALSAAACASLGYNGLALLGTHLSNDLAYEISRRRFRGIVVMLDPGAESQAKAVYNRLRSYVGCPVATFFLRDDPKNLSRHELSNVLESFFATREGQHD